MGSAQKIVSLMTYAPQMSSQREWRTYACGCRYISVAKRLRSKSCLNSGIFECKVQFASSSNSIQTPSDYGETAMVALPLIPDASAIVAEMV